MTAAEAAILDRDPAVLLVVDAHEPSRIGLGLLLQRESWVLRCVVAGTVERAIQLAQRHRPELFLGPDTVKKHASSLYRKLGVRNRTEATQQASRLLTALS